MISTKIRYVLFMLCFLALSCQKEKEYSLATLDVGTTYYRNGVAISEVLDSRGMKIKVLTGPELGSFVNCRKIWNDEIDFAIAQNDTKVIDFLEDEMSIAESKIRTVIPLYPEILFILYADSIHPVSLHDLVKGRRIGVGPRDSGTSRFFRFLLDNFGIPHSDYTFVHTPWLENEVGDNIDVSVTLAGYNTPNVIDMIVNRHCNIFSFGDVGLFQKGSAVEGFCMKYTAARPFIIPMNTYGEKPYAPVLTIAIDAVLLCHRDIDAYTVYAMVEEIFNQKNVLSDKDPLLSGLSEKFDKSSLSFPLHEGTQMYLERNEPTFFERYAEIMGVLLSVLIALVGAMAAILRWKKHRKKNRVDIYYQKALDVEAQIDNYDTIEKCDNALAELKYIKHEAFQLMIAEKLQANESFNIFLLLVDNLSARIEHRKVCNQQ